MKTLCLALCALLCFSGITLAQSTLAGKVTDEAGKPMPFVTVALMAAGDSALVKATASGPEGAFVFEDAPTGRYFLQASMVGYHTQSSSYFESSDTPKTLLDLMLYEAVGELNEVLVTAKKPFVEQRIDRMIVYVENSIISSGSTALEVLQKTPGVTVDYQNERVQLRGKEGVIVQIDGKQSYLSQEDMVKLLRTMSSDNIATIEIITNPGTRYDAAGNAGIINIRLKKNTALGTNGSASVAGGSGFYPRKRGSLQLNSRTARLNMFGSYSLNQGGNYFSILMTSLQPDPSPAEHGRQTQATTTNFSPIIEFCQNAKAGLDFSPTKNTIVGLVWTGFEYTHDAYGDGLTTFSPSTEGPVILQTITEKNYNLRTQNHLANLNVQHSSGKAGQLSADVDYVWFSGHLAQNLLTDKVISIETPAGIPQALFSDQPTRIDIRTAKVDYTQSLPNGWKVESGMKWAGIRNDNDLVVRDGPLEKLQVSSELSNHFLYSERIGAAYTSITGGIGRVDSLKTKVQIGLRAEHTRSIANSLSLNQAVDRKYLNFFPSLFLSRPLAGGKSLTLSYSYRIDRPNYQDLNPARHYVDQFTFAQGNIQLKPQYTSAFELRYGLKNGAFLSLGANLTTDLVTSMVYGVEGRGRFIIWKNSGNARGLVVTAGRPMTVTKGWELQTTLLGYYNQYQLDYEGRAIEIRNWAGRLNASNAFTLGKGWSAELSGWLATPAITVLNRTPWMGTMDAGIQKTVAKALKIKLSLQDVFRTNFIIDRINIPQKLIADSRIQWDTRIALLSLTYTFGNQKVKEARQRKLGSEEESGRAN